MAKFETVKGQISHKQDMQNISGRVHKGTGHVRTKHRTVFNIDGQTAELNGTGGMYFSEGDDILAVGEMSSDGVFHVMGYKNISSGVIKKGSTIIPLILGISCIFFGVWTYFFIITPILFIPLGLMSIWGSYKGTQANKLLTSIV